MDTEKTKVQKTTEKTVPEKTIPEKTRVQKTIGCRKQPEKTNTENNY